MSLELAIEKKEKVEKVSPESIAIFRKFVDERYPENPHALDTYKNTRKHALQAINALERNYGYDERLEEEENDKELMLLRLKEALDLLGGHVTDYQVRKVPDPEFKIPKFKRIHEELMKYVNGKIERTPSRTISRELMEQLNA
jgi:hypothetical protein